MGSRRVPWWLGVIWVAASCAPVDPPAPRLEPDDWGTPRRKSELPARSGPALTFRRVQFPQGAMSLEVVDEPFDTHAWDRGGVLSQTVALGGDDVLRILVRAGEGETLAAVREEHDRRDAKISITRAGRTCGGSRWIEIYEPEQFIECIEYADGRPSEPGYFPATSTIAHAFRHAGLDVVARWEVPTELRDHYRADERRFFASLSCDDVSP